MLTLQPFPEPYSQKQYVRVETIGRKTGRQHLVLVRFVSMDDRVIVLPQTNSRQDWVANLRANPASKLYAEDGIYSGTARIKQFASLDDPLLAAFTRKYGRQIVEQRYRGQRDYVELRLARVGTAELANLVYDDLETAFDGVAERYDHHIFGNPINSWLRTVSVGVLKQLFEPGDVVLEVGCGTGTETLSLARNGVRIIASDISSRMLTVLEGKARQQGLSDNVTTIHCRADDLEDRIHALGYEKVDGAYSTYGAVNTEPRLDDLFRAFHRLVKKDGVLLLGVWNKYCVYELIGYLFKGRPSLAFARLRNPVPIGKSRFCVASNAYSVSTLGQHLGRFFELKSVFGVGITLPPSNLTRYMPRGRLLRFFKNFDLQTGRVFPFNRLGDHFLAVYSSRADV